MIAENELQRYAPPSDIDAEQSVLGALLIDRGIFDEVSEVLKPADFYRDQHAVIFRACGELTKQHVPIDTITLSSHLKSRNEFELAGGMTYLIALMDAVPTSANVMHYAKIVRNASLRRTIIQRHRQTLELAYDLEVPIEDLIDRSEQLMAGLEISSDVPFVSIAEAGQAVYDEGEENAANKVTTLGIPTGFQELDAMIEAERGKLIIIAGRPGSGKSAFMLNVACFASEKCGKVAALWSLEMGTHETATRVLSARLSLNGKRLRKGWIQGDQWLEFDAGVRGLEGIPLFLAKTATANTRQIRSEALWLRRHVGLDYIFIDYLQLLDPDNEKSQMNRALEIGRFTRFLKNLARELNVPVVILSQLSREVEKRENKRPILSDLRDSGSIESDADIVLMMYRESYYRPKTQEVVEGGIEIDEAEVIVAKNRGGENGFVKLNFIGKYTRFEPLPVDEMGALGATGF